MEEHSDYYVYVYIDPRNFEAFYYGKGKGNRKKAHLVDKKESKKVDRNKSIKNEVHLNIIKVIAKNLTEDQAFLIEATLIWKSGESLTNDVAGHLSRKFRAHDTLHLDLSGFDFRNGLYFVNVGEGQHRCWEDCKQYGFLSAGQDPKYSKPLKKTEVGDYVVAYLKGKGT